MAKHRWRESFRSFFGSHIDPIKDEELKENKAEIERDVQKIIEVLKDDEKEPLINLVENFHNHYQSLYARYDHLTEELRKKADNKHGENSSSSSSDSSDSDDSPKKNSAKNGEAEDNFDNKLEMALSEVADLKGKLAMTIEEKETLHQKFQSELSKQQEAQKFITELNSEAEKWNDEKSRLLTEITDLKVELESSIKLQAELSQKLEEMIRDRESLSIEKDAALMKTKEEKKNTEELRTIYSQLQNEKNTTQLALETVKGDLSSAMENLGLAESKITELSEMLKDAEEQKSSLTLKISQLHDEVKHRENKNQDLVTESSQLSKKLAEKERELSSQLQSYEAFKEAAKEKLESAEKEIAKVNQMHKAAEEERGRLSIKISQLEDDIKEAANKMQGLVTVSNQLKESYAEKERELSSHLEIHEAHKKVTTQKLETTARENTELSQMHKAVEEENCSLSLRISQLEDEIKQAENKIQDLIMESSQLSERYFEKERELSSHLEIHEAHKKETSKKLESTANEITGLIQIQKAMEEEKTSLSLKISQLEDDKKQAENKIHDLVAVSSQLTAKLVEKEGELSSHLEIHEAHREEAKGELESAAKEISKLNEMQKAAEVENACLSLKISQLENEIKQAENKIQDFAAEKRQLSEKLEEKERELSSHLEIHESFKEQASIRARDLELELDSSHAQRRDMEKEKENTISALHGEIVDLNVKLELLRAHEVELEEQIIMKASEASAQVKDLTDQGHAMQKRLDLLLIQKFESEKQLQKRSTEAAAYLTEIATLKEELRNKNSELSKSIEERKDFLLQMKDLSNEQQQLRGKCEDLSRMQEEKENLLINFLEKEKELLGRENEAYSVVKTLTKDKISLQEQLETLDAQKRMADISLETMQGKIKVFQDSIEELKRESEGKIADNERLTLQVEGLLAEVNALRGLIHELNASKKQVDSLQHQLEVVRSEKKELEVEMQESSELVKKMEAQLRKSEENLEIKVDEMKRALEDTEVQQRLTSQKLRITEQLLLEKEKEYVEKEEKLMREQSLLSGTVSAYKDAQAKVANVMLRSIDALESKFEEACGQLESHVCVMVEEVKETKKLIKERNEETDKLRDEIVVLVEKANGEKEKRLELIKGTMVEAQKRLQQDEELMRRVKQEKIDAIKELCNTIEYYRTKYCELKEIK